MHSICYVVAVERLDDIKDDLLQFLSHKYTSFLQALTHSIKICDPMHVL